MSSTHPFLESIAEALRSTLSNLNSSLCAPSVNAAADSSTAVDLPSGCLQVRCSGTLQGNLFVHAEENALQALLPIPEGASPNDPDLWLTVWRTALDQVRSSDVLREAGQRFECKPPVEAVSGQPLGDLVFSSGESSPATVRLFADRALIASLKTTLSWSGHDAQRADPILAAPLDRVIDVPLAVTLRFGQRQLTLRELLELNTGSLLELDQQVEEPVNLMLNERVIARGEVVIVDGNYGMRVTEVVDIPVSSLSSWTRTKPASLSIG